MIIESKGNSINSFKEWESCINKKDWVKGKSAYSIADFVINKEGETYLKNEISKLLGEDVVFTKATPELVIDFDKYGKGRTHDLGVYGKTNSGKSVFIGVEAKVNEPFDDKIADVYLRAKTKELNGERTNAHKRIEELLIRNFGVIKKSMFGLRYQLLYGTIGTISAKADIHLFFVLVFETHLRDIKKMSDNKKDYRRFFESFDNSEEIGSDTYKVVIEGKELIATYRKKMI